jgi:hypothetical protein
LGNTLLNLAASGGDGQLVISGDVNGTAFACPVGNIACAVPITSEGYGTVNYRVDASTGGSASGAASYQLDATSPQFDGTLSGAGGVNGWFISEVEFSASASDALTGIAAFEIAVDGGGYQPYAPVTLSDGVHTVSLRAVDGAGNAVEMSQTVKVDAVTPLLDVSVSGAAGENGWYVSQTEVTAQAQDDGSGIAALEVALDGSAFVNYQSPITLSDGIHTLQFRATDNAGNVTTVEQEVKVDTLTPALNVSINGKKGLNGWYTSLMQVLAEANDSGSGIASIEAAADGGAWSIVHGPLSFSDGFHSWQFRVKDKAGNQTETPVQSLKVDTIAPFVEMPETLSLGERLYYSLQDDGSGLAAYRAVIEDDAEKYQKLSWAETMSGNKAESEILWDGKFKDGVKAKPGEYFITLKISDAAGNERVMTTVVDVNLLNALLPIQSFTPPQSVALSNEAAGEEESPAQSFGGVASGTVAEKTTASTSGGGLWVPAEGKPVSEQTFSKPAETAPSPISTSNILWGAAATALLGATLAEWQRKREEEAACRAAEREERLANGRGSYREAAINYQRSLDHFRARLIEGGFTSQQASALKSQAVVGGFIPSAGALIQEKKENDAKQAEAQRQKILDREAQLAAADAAAAQRKAEEEARRNEAEASRWAGLAANYESGEEEKSSWWHGAWSNVLQPIANFVTGVVYQGVVRNNADSLTIAGIGLFAPEKSSTLENYFQSWERFEENSAISDTFSFQAGKVVGGLLGIAQGVWEIGSGIATGTGGTLISCGTGILCLGGGGASLAIGSAMVAHGAMVLGTSAVETGQQVQSLISSAKKESEMKSYEDARRQGKIGEAIHMDDGTVSDADLMEIATKQRTDIKKPAPTLLNPLKRQAKNISDNIRRTTSETRFLIDLVNLSPDEKITFIQQLKEFGTDMSRVVFCNE